YLSKRSGRNRVSTFTQVPEDILNKDKVFELLSFEIIGKEKHLKKIKEIINDSFENSTTRVVLIQAEAGLGKTKLQLEAVSHALTKESLCLAVRCTEVISSQPYQVLSANLERLMKSLEDGARRIIDSLSEAELSCLIELEPAFQKFSSRLIEKLKLDEKSSRYHLFKALAELMIKLSQQKPLFITFDNFQWVDSATLSLINYLLSNEVNEKICIICAFRNSELIRRFDENKILKQLYEQLQQNQKSFRVELKPLSSEETKKMINSIFDGLEFDEKLNQLFYSKTEGNPYFIEESLKKLVENGSIYFKNEKWQKKEIKDEDISLGIKEIIQDKLKHMD
ncbi:MAG: AAA family ATPase, partial [Candidatus Omnitrophica bacterium]|nr:AAA family ATPase [Candidatus Omnitrophota bacterium]